MLPFLKPKAKQTGVIVQDRQMPESDGDSDIDQAELEEFVKDVIVAISAKDIKQIAQSVKELHDVLHMQMDNKPETNFALQNAKAFNQE